MPFPIPNPYEWDESFRVFYDNLDEEHKGLFQGIFACEKDPTNKGKFESLYNLVEAHFKDEEGMFDKANYVNAVGHKAAHEDFLGKLRGLSVPLNKDNIDFAKDWLVQHIKSVDFKYKTLL